MFCDFVNFAMYFYLTMYFDSLLYRVIDTKLNKYA